MLRCMDVGAKAIANSSQVRERNEQLTATPKQVSATGAGMGYVSIAIVLLILTVWLIGAVTVPFTHRRGPLWVRILAFPAGFLMAVGAIGFFGGALSASGGLRWLPRSFEWPVGSADGVIDLPNGDHVVPLTASSRIQVYDRDWRFLRGWYVDASGGHFHLTPSGLDRFDVFAARRSLHYVFTANGDLIFCKSYPRGAAEQSDTGKSVIVPTPIWLWVFSGPFYSWLAAALGIVMLIAIQKNSRGQQKHHRRWSDLSTVEEAPAASERNTFVNAAAARSHLPDSFLTAEAPLAGDGRVSFGRYGFLASGIVWTLGWIAVSSVAIARMARSVELASIIGVVVSVVMMLIGIRAVAFRAIVGGIRAKEPSSAESWGRRITGWFAALFWCAGAVVWNVGIFGVLLREAHAGHGWVVLLLVLWSLIGWFLLSVLFVGIGCGIDAIIQAMSRRG
jgi:hypothetical protein